MQHLTISTCHQILSRPIGTLNQMELAILNRLQEIYGHNIEKFALYAKLAIELDAKELAMQVIKI